jgi:hypothetical protein
VRFDLAQRPLDLVPAFENRGDLRRRNASPATVRRPEVALLERQRPRRISAVAGGRREERECELERVVDPDVAAKGDCAYAVYSSYSVGYPGASAMRVMTTRWRYPKGSQSR